VIDRVEDTEPAARPEESAEADGVCLDRTAQPPIALESRYQDLDIRAQETPDGPSGLRSPPLDMTGFADADAVLADERVDTCST
jgi:hypothetical protein